MNKKAKIVGRDFVRADFVSDAAYVEFARRTIDTMTRQELINFCVWNDPQGTFTDEACTAEFGSPTSTEDLRNIVRDDSHFSAFAQRDADDDGYSESTAPV